MARQYVRYTKEELEVVVKECLNFADVARRFGKSPVGGTTTHIKLMCQRWGIDTSHMTGSVHSKGKRSNKRTPPEQRLVMGKSTDHRVAAVKLRRALFDLGVEHKCANCGISEWMGIPLVLEIDHIDECYWNNQRDNLQFLCPNCHSLKSKMPG